MRTAPPASTRWRASPTSTAPRSYTVTPARRLGWHAGPESEELSRSLSGQLEILKQRLQQRTDGDRKLAFIEAELERIQQQVELIREQAAMSTDPELLSRRIDDIAATLGSTGQWIRDQQQVYGAMEDLLTEPPPLAPDARARELQ